MEPLKTFFMGLTVAERDDFALRCETSRPHITNIAYGLKTCSEKLAVAIERESNGAVRAETLRSDVDWEYIRGTAKVAA